MSWLNEPVEIIDDYRTFKEKQTYFLEGWGPVRYRTVTQTIRRYVGCNYTGAKAKADTLKENQNMSDIQVVPAGGGQYHCLATEKIEGAWSAWKDE